MQVVSTVEGAVVGYKGMLTASTGTKGDLDNPRGRPGPASYLKNSRSERYSGSG